MQDQDLPPNFSKRLRAVADKHSSTLSQEGLEQIFLRGCELARVSPTRALEALEKLPPNSGDPSDVRLS